MLESMHKIGNILYKCLISKRQKWAVHYIPKNICLGYSLNYRLMKFACHDATLGNTVAGIACSEMGT